MIVLASIFSILSGYFLAVNIFSEIKTQVITHDEQIKKGVSSLKKDLEEKTPFLGLFKSGSRDLHKLDPEIKFTRSELRKFWENKSLNYKLDSLARRQTTGNNIREYLKNKKWHVELTSKIYEESFKTCIIWRKVSPQAFVYFSYKEINKPFPSQQFFLHIEDPKLVVSEWEDFDTFVAPNSEGFGTLTPQGAVRFIGDRLEIGNTTTRYTFVGARHMAVALYNGDQIRYYYIDLTGSMKAYLDLAHCAGQPAYLDYG